METPGWRLILDLLAKSVAKINAACSDETSDDKKAVESKTQLVVIKMKTICNEKGSNIKKIKDECNYVKGQDPVKLKQVKTVVKKEYIEAEKSLYQSEKVLCVSYDCLKLKGIWVYIVNNTLSCY